VDKTKGEGRRKDRQEMNESTQEDEEEMRRGEREREHSGLKGVYGSHLTNESHLT
jgi:hypothetical protein